jgi:hypothetical protein
MCGRYNFIWDKQIAEMIRLKDLVWGIDPDYELPDGEVFPGQRLPVLVPGGNRAKVALEKWGIKMDGRNPCSSMQGVRRLQKDRHSGLFG